ncbi:5'-nucleotidase [bioreactor metagenome]|uniref:5'-nucleotidase n=1 Tax=bioreactor metagenome TaxID=1076179 RepID=A0A644YMG9_9ZZZZ
MNLYDLVIFDLDGTILDTSEGIVSALKHTIAEFGFSIPPSEVLNTFIGPPVQDSLANYFKLDSIEAAEMAKLFRDRYKDNDLLLATPYEGIFQIMQTLLDHGMQLAIATYKREDYAIRLLHHFSFDSYTAIMHGSDFDGVMKKQDIIRLCITEAGVADYRRIVMVGDTYHDADGADTLGVDFIGVTYGFGYTSIQDIKCSRMVGCADIPNDILKFVL